MKKLILLSLLPSLSCAYHLSVTNQGLQLNDNGHLVILQNGLQLYSKTMSNGTFDYDDTASISGKSGLTVTYRTSYNSVTCGTFNFNKNTSFLFTVSMYGTITCNI